jgi:F-type H+-transporting ATPase subunit b
MNQRRCILALLPALFLLTSCESDKISDPIQDTIENALPNLWVSLAQLGAFLVTVFLFFRFAYKPLKKKMAARADKIEKDRQEAENDRKAANESKEIADRNIQASRVRANEILQEAEKNAQVSAAKIEADARAQMALEKKQNEIALEQRKKQLEEQDHDRIVKAAMETSKAILGRELTKEDNDRFVEQYVNDLQASMEKKE